MALAGLARAESPEGHVVAAHRYIAVRKSSFARPDLGAPASRADGGALALPARVRGDNYGLVPVQAGLGQILLALVPLATLLLAVLWRQERVRGAAFIGTFFALVGSP